METKLEIVNCATCPFARHLDGNRYVCTNSATASDVVRGHWEVGTDCHEKLEAFCEEIEKEKVLNELDELFAEIEEYKANLENAEWLEAWYRDYDNWLYEGDELVGCQDPEPLEVKYPHLRADYNPNLDEL